MKVLVIIPARYGSTRFPGKPLAIINGKTMIEHVYRGARESTKIFDLVVATDDKRIFNVVLEFGGKALMTSETHLNGTSRCIEIAELYEDIDWIINVQGDEPMMNGKLLDQVIGQIQLHPNASIVSMVRKLDESIDATNPNIVKCVFDLSGKALYFSRSPIPYFRDSINKIYYQHLGIYAYKKDVLASLNTLLPSALEFAA